MDTTSRTGVVSQAGAHTLRIRDHNDALRTTGLGGNILLSRRVATRDDDFKDESGRPLPSRTAVSEIGERLSADDQEFASRDLSEYGMVYLFVDGIARAHPPRATARAGAGGPGLCERGPQGPVAPDGRKQGGP